MSQPTTIDTASAPGDGEELDVRAVPKPQRHPLIFTRFDSLAVGESFVLVNSHDPKHLHGEFERDHPGAYDWSYLPTSNSRLYRIKITRRVPTDLPRVVADTSALHEAVDFDADAGGAVWRLEPAARLRRQHHPAASRRTDPGPPRPGSGRAASRAGRLRTDRHRNRPDLTSAGGSGVAAAPLPTGHSRRPGRAHLPLDPPTPPRLSITTPAADSAGTGAEGHADELAGLA